MSEDFYNVFSNSSLDDYRKIKDEKLENFIYIISYVRKMGSFEIGYQSAI